MYLLDYFQYPFFVNALIGVALISISAGMIGTYIITRRLVAISGGVTHACFGGLGLGYFLGVNPILMAGVFAVASSVSVEWMSSRFRLREDSAIAVIWALGMAIGVLFVFLTPGFVPELNTFLFGNITSIAASDVTAFAIYTGILILLFALNYRTIVACAFDRDFASVIGLPAKLITYTMTVMIAIGIVLTIRLVGVMMLMSMLSLPIMIAEIFMRRFSGIMVLSAAVSLVCSIAGVLIGTYTDVPCSAIIVLLMAALFLLCKSATLLPHRLNPRHTSH